VLFCVGFLLTLKQAKVARSLLLTHILITRKLFAITSLAPS
jgi:hypothetical protein